MRATHPFLLLLPLLAATLIALNSLTALAIDLVFLDGKTSTDVRIVSQGAEHLGCLVTQPTVGPKTASPDPFAVPNNAGQYYGS